MNSKLSIILRTFSLLWMILPILLFAQQNDVFQKSIIETSKQNTDSDTTSIILNEGVSISGLSKEDIISFIGTLSSKVQEQETKLTILQDSLILKKDTILKLRKDTVKLNGMINKLKKENTEKENEINNYKIIINNWNRELTKLDQIIYKQCLLYPLEGRFNSNNITEAIATIETVQTIIKNPSDEFVQYKSTYLPLLQKYEQYNNQLIELIESQVQFIKAVGWIISVRKERFEYEIKQLPYYNECYINKDIPPYKSIVYLDEAIDKYFKILKSTNVVQIDIEELLDSLKPKK